MAVAAAVCVTGYHIAHEKNIAENERIHELVNITSVQSNLAKGRIADLSPSRLRMDVDRC